MSILMNCTVDTVKVWVERLCLDFAALCQSFIIIPASENLAPVVKEEDVSQSAPATLAEVKEITSVIFENDTIREQFKTLSATSKYIADAETEKLFDQAATPIKTAPITKGQITDTGVFLASPADINPGTLIGLYTGVGNTLESVPFEKFFFFLPFSF
jgi:hypothetical protein